MLNSKLLNCSFRGVTSEATVSFPYWFQSKITSQEITSEEIASQEITSQEGEVTLAAVVRTRPSRIMEATSSLVCLVVSEVSRLSFYSCQYCWGSFFCQYCWGSFFANIAGGLFLPILLGVFFTAKESSEIVLFCVLYPTR